MKSSLENHHKFCLCINLKDDTNIWLRSPNHDKVTTLSNKYYEKIFLDRWSHGGKKRKEKNNDLFSFTTFLLRVH